MSLPTLVQFKSAESGSSPLTLTSTPTPGNLIVLILGGGATAPPTATGFTQQATALNDVGTAFFRRTGSVQTRIVQPGDTTSIATPIAFTGVWLAFEFSNATLDSIVSASSQTAYGAHHQTSGGGLIPTAGRDVRIYGVAGVRNGNGEDLTHTSTPDAGWTQYWFTPDLNWNLPQYIVLYKDVTGTSGTYTPGSTMTLTGAANGTSYFGFTFGIIGSGLPVADFTATTVTLGGTTEFEDTSTNAPTSWLWDFGDGNTSTSQNPTHVYGADGTYSVSLTVTNASGSDAVTHDVTVQAVGTPDPEVPSGVLLEIYAASPGSARWDVAKWDVDEWSGAGWQDVTPYGIHVNILWGASRGDQGILTVPDAASWAVDYYDPDRILDPSNESGPYFGDLKPYLPIRASHRRTVVRQGIVTGISHSFAKGNRVGYMRAADNITILANAQVPSDTTLSDTLYARAVDAIAAAGLSVTVAAPIGTDPPVSPWVTGVREWSVWEWIKDAAQEVLHIPIIDRLGTVTFRPWASPLARGRTINSDELLDMQDVTDYSGQYSVVQAVDDMDVVTERRLTPTPAYGARTFKRDEPTLDPDAWADAVLADRALPGLLWLPGDVYPLTANAVERYALLEAVELVSMSLPEQSPPVFASGIVVGGEIDIIGRAQDQQGVWRFNFQTAQTATEPLIETGGGATDYLLRTGGGEYLYPTGSA